MAGTDGVANVTFSAGAPLDPDDLNLLQTNIQLINTTASVYNKTIDGIKTIPSLQSGTYDVVGLKKGVTVEKKLPVFNDNPQISIMIHHNRTIEKDTLISTTVDKTTTPWTVYFRTNQTKEINTLSFDWIAIAMVPIV